ncbi:peroxidase 24-like [Rutidosis leptorrhynchoides]|uniref:peroxidase 24-like n=1 Tax=Rutidosis leptorrhynchoides TaxID=125765 RepID=UPI003A98F812
MRGSLIVLLSVMLVSLSLCHGYPKFKKQGKLQMKFYHKTCRDAETIVRDITWKIVAEKPELAAKLLRLQFHDCFVRGCDASILLNSVNGNKAEKDSPPNFSLVGYEIIDEIKTELEKRCPRNVSCADIIALATRDAVSYQFRHSLWPVFTGRKDGKISNISEPVTGIPSASSNFSILEERFADVGLNVSDLVALSGAHTIGITHCGVIQRRLYNFTGKGDTDPTIDADYAKTLKETCPIPINRTTEVDLDPNSTLKFDSNYFKVVRENKGVFTTDATLLTNSKSRMLASIFEDELMFFKAFAKSMVKMSSIGVITGDGERGEIRQNCRFAVVVEYKVSMYCNACERSVVKILSKIDGIETFLTEMSKHRVVVTGKINPQKVLKKLKKKTGKKVEIIEPEEDENSEENESKDGDSPFKLHSQLVVEPFIFDCYTEIQMLLMFSDENPNACLIM